MPSGRRNIDSVAAPLNNDAMRVILMQNGKHASYVFIYKGMDLHFFENGAFLDVLKFFGGALFAFAVQKFGSKRCTFTYYVNHVKVATSADDPVFGSLKVTWNGSPVSNAFMSTIELRNESFQDFEDVLVRAYTNDTLLVTQATYVLGTPEILEFSEAYKKQIEVAAGHQVSDLQRDIYRNQREYLIRVMNRGQIIRIQFLNFSKSENMPNIHLAVNHKGVALKYRTPGAQVAGVPLKEAIILGTTFGILCVFLFITLFQAAWVGILLAFSCGIFATAPGILMIKLWRRLRSLIAS